MKYSLDDFIDLLLVSTELTTYIFHCHCPLTSWATKGLRHPANATPIGDNFVSPNLLQVVNSGRSDCLLSVVPSCEQENDSPYTVLTFLCSRFFFVALHRSLVSLLRDRCSL